MATYQTEDGKTIISHNSLEDIIHNELPYELETKYDIKLLCVSETHNVAQCVFVDKQGRRIIGIGETTAATLKTEVARNNPSLMATQRAFDRAAIRYLRLPGKVYSNLEGVDDSAATTTPSTPPPSEQKPPVQKPPVQEPQKPTKAEETAPKQLTVDELGATIYQLGPNYRNNPCPFSELWIKDNKTFKWLTEKFIGPNDAGKELKARAIEYRKLMEAQGNVPASAKKPQEEPVVKDISVLGKEKCNVAAYGATPITLEELWKRDQTFFNWLCDKYQAPTEAAKKIQKSARIYREGVA